ncbi:hypothetical protein STASHLEY_00800 [Brevundimonas phage vB_BpoS-StAshley]|nr:hypothetical protein STASHLEY_00800 [Brevundimonas phage vB_BpoS-StAshley]
MPKRNEYLRKLLKRFEAAVTESAFKGSQHPDDWDAIDKEHKEAKAGLLKYCEERL